MELDILCVFGVRRDTFKTITAFTTIVIVTTMRNVKYLEKNKNRNNSHQYHHIFDLNHM